VALSRCKTFEGMVLSSPLSEQMVKTDAVVAQFVGKATRNPPTADSSTSKGDATLFHRRDGFRVA
jgi:hypothetical protein